jgi:hypothetical protein
MIASSCRGAGTSCRSRMADLRAGTLLTGCVSWLQWCPSATRGPVLPHPGYGFFFAHSRHVGFAEAHLRQEQVDEIGRERLRGWLGRAAVSFLPSWTHVQNVT